MFGNFPRTAARIAGCGLLFALFGPFQFAHAGSFDLLWSFKGPAQGDGAFPQAGLMRDASGDLFGTTAGGGAYSMGAVFEIAADGTESVLYSFKGGNDGAAPLSQLIADAAGNFYGTTARGGTGSVGTIFKLAPNGKETVLYSFQQNGKDGVVPLAGLVMDPAGNLYGTTQGGGTSCYDDRGGCGTVFEFTAGGKEKILHSFTGYGSDGALPYYGSLVMDQSGNLYGTTGLGGANDVGAIFEVTPGGTETVLHSCDYISEPDCVSPYGGLAIDQSGNLYGTSEEGGYRDGDVFEIGPDGGFSELYEFTDRKDSMYPITGVILDQSGNLFGTTVGTAGKPWCGPGCATVFKLAPDGTETVLHRFLKKKLGAYPQTQLISDGNGNLYGTTVSGGDGDSGKHCGEIEGPNGCGTVFRVKE
jgi:uncharacterized repeat protein (TIGR03803 family)